MFDRSPSTPTPLSRRARREASKARNARRTASKTGRRFPGGKALAVTLAGLATVTGLAMLAGKTRNRQKGGEGGFHRDSGAGSSFSGAGGSYGSAAFGPDAADLDDQTA
jgi:uncharacterized membrane protein YgcG